MRITQLISMMAFSLAAYGMAENSCHSSANAGVYFTTDSRLHHAKELLGGDYLKSIVHSTELNEDVNSVKNYIEKYVSTRLHPSFRKKAKKISKAIVVESARYGLDPFFILAVIQHESRFNPIQKGRHGEIGLMQIKPSTAKWVSDRTEIQYLGKKTLQNPVRNIQLATAYMSYLRAKFKAQSHYYVSAYNMGAQNVYQAMSKKIIPQTYKKLVMKEYLDAYAEYSRSI